MDENFALNFTLITKDLGFENMGLFVYGYSCQDR